MRSLSKGSESIPASPVKTPVLLNPGVNSPKKRKYNREDSKRRLMVAASGIFSKEGYDAATTREIAQKAGINESLIQRYFKNKLGLFSAILEQFQKRLMGSLPYPPAESLEKELQFFFEYRLQFAQKEKKFIRLAISRSLVDRHVREQMRGIYQNGIPVLIQRLEKLQGEGKVRQDISLTNMSIVIGLLAFSLSLSLHILLTVDSKLGEDLVSLATKILSKGLTSE